MNRPAIEKMILQIESDLDLINKTFSIMSSEQRSKLIRDVKYVFLDNIAREIRFSFYDQRNKNIVFYQYLYKNNGEVEHSGNMQLLENMRVENIAFDVFIEFTEPFLGLDSKYRDILLKNTEYEWYI